jgi:DivIVA domain-containing protein
MAPVAVDRQTIERRDFPIGRRGYDPAAVDAHLREVAAAFEELQRAGVPKGETSRAVAAGLQVQGIIEAAERAQADIEREAREKTQRTRDEALLDAARIREDAIAQARTLVAAVTQATSVLLERVGSMDGELATLVESLRAGATRLTGDLAAVKGNMGELYDAASARTGSLGAGAEAPAVSDVPAREIAAGSQPQPQPPAAPTPESAEQEPAAEASAESAPAPSAPAGGAARTITAPEPASPSADEQAPEARFEDMAASLTGHGAAATVAPAESAVSTTAPQAQMWTTPAEEPAAAPPPPAPAHEDGDLDGARLIALNMALNGETRADAERYLAEHFKLVDRAKLIDEVYAAIEA